MKPTFDAEQFEKLNGMELGRYCIDIFRDGELISNYLDYLKANTSRWDGQHLEMALMLLRKMDSDAGRHEIANHLSHPLKHIRLTVLGFIDRFDVIDGYILSRIDERLLCATEKFEVEWIRQLQDRALKSSSARI